MLKTLALFDQFLLAWLAVVNVWTFIQFGLDKWQASRRRERTSEARLLLLSAVGGWPGGFFAMMLFRHKTGKLSFLIKFAGAFVICAALVWCAVKWRTFRQF